MSNTPSNPDEVPAQLLLDVVLEQRNNALNDAGKAIARSIHFQYLNEELRDRVKELETELAKKG